MTTLDRHPLFRGTAVIAAALVLFVIGFAVHEEPEPPPPAATSQPLPSPTATPEATPTSAGTPTATPEPTAMPGPGPEPAFSELPPALDTDEAGTWVWEPLNGDQQPSADHGVLIRNIETGDSVHWRLAEGPAAGADFYAYGVAGDGRFATYGIPSQPQRLVDRPSDAAVHWDTEELRFVAASADGRLLLGITEPEDAVCLFWAIDLASGAPEPLLRFGLRGNQSCDGVSGAFGPPDSELLLVGANDASSENDGTVYAVDLGAGQVEAIADTTPYRTLQTDHRGAYWIESLGDLKEPPLGVSVAHTDWGSLVALSADFAATAEGNRIGPVLVAPDGRLVAWQEALPLGKPGGLGGWFEWPVVVVGDIESGEVLLRVIRGALFTGVETTGWLADSSGLVITIEGQFALLELGDPADGSNAAVTPLPFAHSGHFDPQPDPSPGNPALFAYDHRFVDLDGVDVFTAIVTDWARGGLRGDWTSGGAEYYVATWDLGAGDFGDGPLAPLGLGPRLELPPFTNELRLVTAEAIELRETAALSSEATWPLEAGTALAVENDASQNCLFDLGCATLIERGPDLDPRP